ncbi:MAG: hypothetical protein U0X40_06445 [Ferruginibacter sp.]
MTTPKIKQLQYESDTWKRLLGFIADENVHLKNRLASVLSESADDHLLYEAENFQNLFIREDERVGYLRNELAELDKMLTRDITEVLPYLKNIEAKLNRIRHNIRNVETNFGRLKSAFNNYMAGAID